MRKYNDDENFTFSDEQESVSSSKVNADISDN
jgi:hypothetical protein